MGKMSYNQDITNIMGNMVLSAAIKRAINL